jgi:protease-4
MEGKPVTLIGSKELLADESPYETNWGEPPVIAVVYALGICDMDTGMNIRSLSAQLDDLVYNPLVAAVVVRIDSPGGSPLASDVLAESIARLRKQKPVVISLGSVAASGGYWIATGSDTIVGAPMSITGSIGVAGGWMYNKGLKEKLGITTDLVKTSEHADFAFPFTLPFLNIGLPDRNLTEDERLMFEAHMRTVYAEFTDRVSKARGLAPEKTEEIARGRVWPGVKALELKLIDGIGGLCRAIEIAKEKSGISIDEKFNLLELPDRNMMTLPLSLLRMIDTRLPISAENDYLTAYTRFRIANNGKSLVILETDDAEAFLRE